PGAADVFLGNGNGTFGVGHVFRTDGGAGFGVATGDFNGDGRPDLAVANTFSNDVRVRLNTSTLAPATTTTTLRTSIATAVFGHTEVLTSTVGSPAGTPTGTVAFRDGNTLLGTVPVNAAGQATLAVSLGVGNHTLTVAFVGSGGFDDSVSAAAAVTV